MFGYMLTQVPSKYFNQKNLFVTENGFLMVITVITCMFIFRYKFN